MMDKEAVIAELHAKGMSLRKISEVIGIPYYCVQYRAKKQGLSPHPPGRPPKPTTVVAREMFRGGAGVKNVISATGITREKALRIQGEVGLPTRDTPAFHRAFQRLAHNLQ